MSDWIEAMARHLPPSASQLHLLDVNGQAGAVLQSLRHDLLISAASGDVRTWTFVPDCFDAVVAYGYVVNDAFLQAALAVLRPGGRLIVLNPHGAVTKAAGQQLEAQGYVRILVEAATEAGGVLVRGERAHITHNTLERIQQVAGADGDMLDVTHYRGRYVYLLIRQTPNKPVWRITEDDVIEWWAVALDSAGQKTLLAFSSLPKAVSFMQAAVLAGRIKDVNKVGKFSKATAATWTLPLVLNPSFDGLHDAPIAHVMMDPTTAEAPDE